MRMADAIAMEVITIAIAVWLMCGVYTQVSKSWQKDAIEKGFAEYNQTTGVWQWKENKGGK